MREVSDDGTRGRLMATVVRKGQMHHYQHTHMHSLHEDDCDLVFAKRFPSIYVASVSVCLCGFDLCSVNTQLWWHVEWHAMQASTSAEKPSNPSLASARKDWSGRGRASMEKT